MCQTRCGESRLTATSKGVAVDKITSKYLKKGSMVIVAVEPFQFMYGFCYRITERRWGVWVYSALGVINN